ncbi:MAG TPA: hypothetical protein VGG45_01030 [Terracidiphilus sp.]
MKEDIPQGAKSPTNLIGFIGTDEQLAEKVCVRGEKPQKHPSGPKGHVDIAAFEPGINPRPTARLSFSAACKGHIHSGAFAARDPPTGKVPRSCPDTKPEEIGFFSKLSIRAASIQPSATRIVDESADCTGISN